MINEITSIKSSKLQSHLRPRTRKKFSFKDRPFLF